MCIWTNEDQRVLIIGNGILVPICRSSLMDRQRISTPYYVGSNPTCGAIYAHSSAWTEREATNLGQSGVRISLGVPIYYN